MEKKSSSAWQQLDKKTRLLLKGDPCMQVPGSEERFDSLEPSARRILLKNIGSQLRKIFTRNSCDAKSEL